MAASDRTRAFAPVCHVGGRDPGGVESTRQQDPVKAGQFETGLDDLSRNPTVLPTDAAVFRAWARQMHRQPDTLNDDAMVAATAVVHRLTVVTRNVADFEHFGVPLLNPFSRSRA